MAEEAQPELLAVAMGRGLPFVEQSEQPFAARLQICRRVDLQQAVQRVLEVLFAEVP